MSADLAKAQPMELAPLEEYASGMDLIATAARDKSIDVDKLERLMAMQERMQLRAAEIAFNSAMARLQPKLPTITKHGKASFNQTNYSFARYEDIDEKIRPLLSAEGFSLSFDQRIVDKGVVYSGTLRHAAGHKDTKELLLPADSSGSKNAIQAIGSTVSYAKRYLAGMLLNLVTKGEDDDANFTGFITDSQMNTIIDLIAACELDQNPTAKSKFLEFAEAKTVGEIKAAAYDRVVTALRAKLKAKQ